MIEINNLSFAYKHTSVFSNINLSIGGGNIYGLLGMNGVGKTTLLKLVCGLLRPSSGSCKVDGVASELRLPEMLQRIAFLPDEVSLPDSATPYRFVSDLAPFYPTFSEAAFRSHMQVLEVEPERQFKEMSFGQQKKSLIAATLALGTDYVLLDEPTNGLDIPSKKQLRSLLSQRADEQSTIVISTHQVRDVENLIDPIVILSGNAVLLNASVSEITKHLYFEHGAEQRSDALYSELTPTGYTNVLANTTGEESQVNIEALFESVLHNKNLIDNMFNSHQQ